MDDILVMYFRWTLDLVTSMMQKLVSEEVVLLLYPKPIVMKTTFTKYFYNYYYDVMQHTHSSSSP